MKIKIMLIGLCALYSLIISISGGSISGRVTDDGGNPIEDISIIAQMGYLQETEIQTDANGNYDIQGLAEGEYFVYTSSPNNKNYIDKYYDNIVRETWVRPYNTTRILVSEESITPNINFFLATGGVFTGTVKDDSDNPLEGVEVAAINTNGYPLKEITNAEGKYTLAGLREGLYYIKASASLGGLNFLSEYYNEVRDASWPPAGATQFYIMEGGSLPNINFNLTAGGMITGNLDVGNYVSVIDENGELYLGTVDLLTGDYYINDLPSGNYKVFAADCERKVAKWHDDIQILITGSCSSAGRYPPSNVTSVVALEGITTPNIDFALPDAGKITGTVVDENGSPVHGLLMRLKDFVDSNTTRTVSSVWTDENGNYTFQGLLTGTYYVRTESQYYSNPLNYMNEWYDNIPVTSKSGISSNAAGVDITIGFTTPEIDFMLKQGGAISGMVKDIHSNPIKGIWISVYNSLGDRIGITETESDGQYEVSGLPSSSYYIRTSSNGSIYQNEWHENIPAPPHITNPPNFPSNTIPINVIAGFTNENINFTLEDDGGVILGKITDEAGNPIGGIHMGIYKSSGSKVKTVYTSSIDGGYVLSGIPAGSYYLVANNEDTPGYLGEWYSNIVITIPSSLPHSSATPVNMLSNQTVIINMELTKKNLEISSVVRSVEGVDITWNTYYETPYLLEQSPDLINWKSIISFWIYSPTSYTYSATDVTNAYYRVTIRK